MKGTVPSSSLSAQAPSPASVTRSRKTAGPALFIPKKRKPLGFRAARSGRNCNLEKLCRPSDGTSVLPSQVLGAPRSGRKFSYVTDTLYFPDIAPEVADSDLLVCEGMFERELESSAVEKKHMTAEQAARIAAEAGGVKKLALIIIVPRYTEQNLKQLLKEAQTIFPDTVLSRDRALFPLEYQD